MLGNRNTPHLLRRRRAAFSLIELVIVVVIIAIIAAIAIPRMSRGAAGAADSALSGNLRVLRSAIDLYATEHGGNYPSLTNLTDALTKYSDETGTTFSATKNGVAGVVFGPYLRAVPALPVGSAKGKTLFTGTAPGGGATPADTTAGWYYDAATGTIKANCGDLEKDARETPYNTY
jgi:general secretion pathway protein G